MTDPSNVEPTPGVEAASERLAPTGRCSPAPGSALTKLRYKLPPEMSDGQHWAIVDDPAAVIEGVKAWLAEATGGEQITIKTCMMTDEEADALPPI